MSMKKVGLLFVLLLSFKAGFSQIFFISQPTGGAWNLGTTWDQTACASGCVAGVDYPGPNDVAVILVNAGSFVSFPRASSPSFSCKDLFVVYNVTNSIRTTGLSGTPSLNISGQLSGALDDLSDIAEPTVNVFHTTATNLNLVFSGSNLDDPFAGAVITSWGYNSPIYRSTFDAGSGNTLRVDNFATRNSATILSGTFQLNSGQEIHDFTGSSVFTVSAGATLNAFGSMNGGTTANSFGTVIINGTATTGGSSYINATTFNLGAAAVLNVGFNGVNQTQGWWYQTNSPSATLNATSTVNYNANTSQTVAAAVSYGNLTLTSSSAAVKTLSGSGLIITGNLTVGANVTSSPSSQVEFFGAAATQTISGAGTLNFDGGLEVNKSAGTLTVNKAITITGGLTLTAGTLAMAGTSTISGGIAINAGTWNLGDVSTTIASGSFTNGGTVTSGTSGTLTVSGSSTFSGTGSLTLNNLTTTVTTGAATINNAAWSLTGNILNNGSITLPSSTTVTFTGGSAQSISGNALAIGNLTINKTSSTLSNNASIVLTGVLIVTTGTFDADGTGGSFTLNSDTNGDARIGPMAGGSILGEVTFERYFNNTSNRWRNIAFPVTSVTYAELGSSITLNTNSLATYTESTLGDVDQGWNIVAGGTLNSTRGHTAWMYNIAPITISVTGPLLQNVPAQGGSPYNFGVTYTNDPGQPATQDGWNFVPNPFASPIDWNNSGWVKTNVNAAAAVWDIESNVYRYTNVDWDGVVAQGQAFWVQTNAASPVLTCTESAKEALSDPVFYRVASENRSRLMISLKSDLYTDKAVIQFREDASAEFDPAYDAHKLQNPIFNLASMTNEGYALAANTLPKSICTSVVRLNITNIESGSYTLNFEGLQSFTNLNSITLVDHFTEQTHTIEEGALFSFAVTSDSKSMGSDRFEIIFNFSDQKSAPVIQEEANQLTSSFEDGNQWYFNDEPIEGATGKHYKATRTGVYNVSVLDGTCLLKSEAKVIQEVSSRVFPNPATTVLKVDVGGLLPVNSSGDIILYSSQGQLMRSEKFTAHDGIKEVDILGVRPGLYILTLVSDNGMLLEKTKVVIK